MPTAVLTQEILVFAGKALSATDLGVLVRLGLALGDGPLRAIDLARQAKVDPRDLDRLNAWLQACPDTAKIVGFVVPDPRSGRRPLGPRQGQLFPVTEFVLPDTPIRKDSCGIRGATITAGIRLLARGGVGERQARELLGLLLKQHGLGPVAETLDQVDKQGSGVADPRAYLIACLKKRTPPSGQLKGGPAGRPAITAYTAERENARPVATPAFLGLSEERVKLIRENNARITKPLFGGR